MRRGLLALLVLLTLPAHAERSIDAAPFLPASDGNGLVLAERALLPRRFEMGATLLLGYAHAPLRIGLPEPQPGSYNLVSDQLTLDVGLHLALWDFLLIGATLPAAAQWYDDAAAGQGTVAPRGTGMPAPTGATGIYRGDPRQNVGLSAAAPRDLRFLAKGGLRRSRYGLALLLAVTVPTGDAASFLGERSATFRPDLIFDATLGPLVLVGNLGAIVREEGLFTIQPGQPGQPGRPPLLSVFHELTYALGASYRPHRRVSLSLEALGTVPFGGILTNPTAELFGAVYLHPAAHVRLLVSAGGGLIPDAPLRDPVRLFLGASFSTGRAGMAAAP